MRMRTLLALPAGLLLAALAHAQTFSVLVQDGDVVAGVGNVTSINNLAINSSGSWLVEVDTDGPVDFDAALLRDGALLLSEGQPLAAPAGASLGSFDDITLNDAGQSVWNFFLDGTTGLGDDSGIYSGADLVLQEGTASGAAGFSPGTVYVGFFGARTNGPGDGLVMASVDDPLIPSTVDRALVIFDVGAGGALLGETVVAKEGDTPAALGGDAIVDFSTGPHSYDWNASGQVVYVATLTGASSANQALMRGATLIARKGDPSPLGGRNWELLTSRPLSINASGSVFFRANLDGDAATDEALFLDGTLVAREGDPITTSFGTFAIENFGSSAPVLLSDAGDVLYYVNWDDPDTTHDAGLVHNGVLIVEEGVTTVGGILIESLGNGIQDTLALSRDGRWALLDCTLAGGVDAAIRIELGSVFTSCAGDGSGTACPCGNAGVLGHGCDNSFSTGGALLAVASGTPAGNDIVLAGSLMPPSTTALPIRSTVPVVGGGVFGDGLLCLQAPVVRLTPQLTAGGAASFPINHQAGPGTFYYQLWYRNQANFCTPSPFNLSNAIGIVWP